MLSKGAYFVNETRDSLSGGACYRRKSAADPSWHGGYVFCRSVVGQCHCGHWRNQPDYEYVYFGFYGGQRRKHCCDCKVLRGGRREQSQFCCYPFFACRPWTGNPVRAFLRGISQRTAACNRRGRSGNRGSDAVLSHRDGALRISLPAADFVRLSARHERYENAYVCDRRCQYTESGAELCVYETGHGNFWTGTCDYRIERNRYGRDG